MRVPLFCFCLITHAQTFHTPIILLSLENFRFIIYFCFHSFGGRKFLFKQHKKTLSFLSVTSISLALYRFFVIILRLPSIFLPSRTLEHIYTIHLHAFSDSHFSPLIFFLLPIAVFFLQLLCIHIVMYRFYVFRVSFCSGPSHHIISVFTRLVKSARDVRAVRRASKDSIFCAPTDTIELAVFPFDPESLFTVLIILFTF